MIKKLLLAGLSILSFGLHAQTVLTTPVTWSQTVEDAQTVSMKPGFRASAITNPNLTFIARINNQGSTGNPLLCNQYGKVVISEVHFDTHFNERIEDKYHYFGEYIELFNSSTSPIDLTGWIIKDNHTEFTLTADAVNGDFIIPPGGHKIITYGGFKWYGAMSDQYPGQTAGGAPNAIGGRAKFEELFPDVLTTSGYNTANSIVLQNTMVLFNLEDKVSLHAPNGKLVDQVYYKQDQVNNLHVGYDDANRAEIGPYLSNDDGGVFKGPLGGIPARNPDGSYILDGSGNRTYTGIDDNLRKAIYRSTVEGYYAGGTTTFAVATASPGKSPQVAVPLMPLDPNMTSTTFVNPNNDNNTESFAFDIKDGSIIGHSKTYFDDLGKPKVSVTKDFQTNLTWGTETVYDDFGRRWKESFPAPTCMGFDNVKYLSDATYKSQFVDKYYSDNNTYETHQATAQQPYSEINYDNNLNPGNTINTVGGNKIDNEWRTGYSYTIPAAQEMYYVYGYNYYDGAVNNGKEEVITKFFKSVSVDANGVENVAFTDGEGKRLATARSGGSTSYPVYSLIGTQGYVDVHIPAGAPDGVLLGSNVTADYKVFDLKTGLQITPTPTTLASGNGYRVEATTIPTADPKVYIEQTPSGGAITYDNGAKGVSYNVNYYEYAVNVYNKTGQLMKSVQPNGYELNTVVKDVPLHMNPLTKAFISTFTYNDQGQLKEVESPDEGISKFAYRKDGQIRYSQSEMQADTKVSYTNYDEYARVVESGVVTDTQGIWMQALLKTDDQILISGTVSELRGIVYDYPENNRTSVMIPSSLSLLNVLTAEGINVANYVQENLEGNVVIAFSKVSSFINTMTWYSYDTFGRVVWMVQYNDGLGAKTIHYEYDYKGNVSKVIFQKDKAAEFFAHRCTYNLNNMLTKVETSTDNSSFIAHADYEYYVSGELKRTNIGQGVQGLDYVYTLGGQLKSINHPSLEQAKDPGHDANDIFGVILDYHNGDYQRSNTSIASSPTIAGANQDFNGNIKAMRWANKDDITGGVASQKAYTYNYNRNGWLTDATFGSTDNTGAITPSGMFKEGALTYDANGNIKSLLRTDNSSQAVDVLDYSYVAGNNQLNSVNDTGIATSSNNLDLEGNTAYVYNAIGQLEKNATENLEYFYNTQGLTTEVKKSGVTRVKFYYNERGQRVKKESFDASGILQFTDYYVLDFSGQSMAIYNKLAAGNVVQKELPIYGLARLGVYLRDSQGDFMKYEITDHLGNIRALAQKKVSGTMYMYADYYPFGEKLPTRDNITGVYRYAYQGQEMDGETNMEAFQLRLWDGRIGRWLNPDPKGQFSSPYVGMGNNPAQMIDPDGGWCYDAQGNSIPCGGDFSQYNNIWNHTTVLSEIAVANHNYFNTYGPMSEYEGSTFSGAVGSMNFDYTRSFFQVNGKATFHEVNFFNNTNKGGILYGPLSADLGADYSFLKGKATVRAGSKNFNTYDEFSGCIGCLEANTTTGILVGEGGKYGFASEGNAGAYIAKGDWVMGTTILGVKVSYTQGGSLMSAHAGISRALYYDNSTGNLVVKGGFNLGFGIGVHKDAALEVPVKAFYEYFKK
ncbi:lamin tail domain-containing protein [Flavobacterium sp. GCM10027622]|uniref:lamin tail domain-containing protein n=1 Tax=unclassified Flavobacterium TaxID=196869 RepID=UPI003617D9E7